jgi:hypothetical protein
MQVICGRASSSGGDTASTLVVRGKGERRLPRRSDDDRRQLTTAVRIVRLYAVRRSGSDRCRGKNRRDRDNFWQRQSCRQPGPARLIDRRREGRLAAEPPLGSSPSPDRGLAQASPGRVLKWRRGGPAEPPHTHVDLDRTDRSVTQDGRQRDQRGDKQAQEDQAACLHETLLSMDDNYARPGAWIDASLLKS